MTRYAIDAFATPISVTRTTQATTFVNGLAQVTTEQDTFDVTPISVQPMSARERDLLPELIRDKEVLKAYTRCSLRSVDLAGKVKADRVTYKEEAYVVQSVEDWSSLGGFWKVTLVKEND